MSRVIYFGHPINVYNTDLERFLLERIQETFPDWTIENPNQLQHSIGYAEWQRKTGKGMGYYFKTVLPRCHAGVFLPFRDGAWGAGVYDEAEFLLDRGLAVYRITHEGVIGGISFVDVRRLTVEETRDRIRMPNGISRSY
jgi:hypothetical protein